MLVIVSFQELSTEFTDYLHKYPNNYVNFIPCPHIHGYTEFKHKKNTSYSIVINQHISKFMEDINNYITSIQQEVVAEEKTVKVARLIILLIKIEKELATVKETLAKLQSHQQKYNQNSQLAEQIEQKIATVNRLSDKISKARLNLNYYFI